MFLGNVRKINQGIFLHAGKKAMFPDKIRGFFESPEYFIVSSCQLLVQKHLLVFSQYRLIPIIRDKIEGVVGEMHPKFEKVIFRRTNSNTVYFCMAAYRAELWQLSVFPGQGSSTCGYLNLVLRLLIKVVEQSGKSR